MRILICDFDVYNSVGGGQTYYRGLIDSHPGLQFTYFLKNEAPDNPRPANARAVPYQEHYGPPNLGQIEDCDAPLGLWHDYMMANNFAYSIQGQQFDIIDTPDYYRIGGFLYQALPHHKAQAKKIFLSMHGVISTTLGLHWNRNGKPPAHIKLCEDQQYQAVDHRYFISPAYQDEWKKLFPFSSSLLDLFRFFRCPELSRPPQTTLDPPELLFIGRTEKRKGPHLFIQMAWWLNPKLYKKALIIGGPVPFDEHKNSGEYLQSLINIRDLKDRVEILNQLAPDAVARRLEGNVVTFVPSIYDTLNLVALESLLAGSPTVIGSGAGVCRLLRERLPEIPFVEFDIKNFYGSLSQVNDLLENYPQHRKQLAEGLQKIDRKPRGPTMEAIYASPSEHDAAVREELARVDHVMFPHLQRGAIGLAAQSATGAKG